MKQLRWLVMPVMAGVLALSSACGGDKDDSSGDSASSGNGSAASRELNLTNAVAELEELRSFRMSLALKMDFGSGNQDEPFAAALMGLFTDISLEGSFLAPDSLEMKMKLLGEEVRYIQIGQEAWVNEGSGWVKADATNALGSLGGSPLDFATNFLPDEVLRGAETKAETVNGIKTTRYSFDKEKLQDLAQQLGEDTAGLEDIDQADLDVWLTAENIPVKMALKVIGQDADGEDISMEMDLNITDLNSEAIKISRPI